jgi:hypothetical protein
MLLGECPYCAAPFRLAGNLGSLLLSRSYFCPRCGHPGPNLTTVLRHRVRSFPATEEGGEELVPEEQAG